MQHAESIEIEAISDGTTVAKEGNRVRTCSAVENSCQQTVSGRGRPIVGVTHKTSVMHFSIGDNRAVKNAIVDSQRTTVVDSYNAAKGVTTSCRRDIDGTVTMLDGIDTLRMACYTSSAVSCTTGNLHGACRMQVADGGTCNIPERSNTDIRRYIINSQRMSLSIEHAAKGMR